MMYLTPVRTENVPQYQLRKEAATLSTTDLKMHHPKQSLGGRIVYHFQKHWRLHVLALPAMLCLIFFNYAPMFGVVLAFQNYTIKGGFFGSEWVGLKNFEFLFATTDAWRITRNTILYNVAFILLNTGLAVIFAMLFNELYVRKVAKTLQTLVIMPYFLSWAVIGIIVYAFMAANNGMVNQILGEINDKVVRTNWYMKKEIWPFLLTFVYLWKNVAYSGIVYVASISGISQDYYEAAVLDGASKIQQARYITLPHLKQVIVIMLILNVGGIMRGDFGLFYNVTQNNGRLYEYTDVVDTYVYRALINLNNTGMSAAAGLYQNVIGFILIILANLAVKKVDEDAGLF